jgi:Skp family chaperone for outer membrane proteins
VNRFLVFAATVGVLWPMAASAQAQVSQDALASRLAYFSPRRAFALSAEGKTAQTKLAALESETDKQLAARNAKLKEMQATLAQSASVLGEAALRQRELEVERFQIDTKRFLEDAQAQFLGVQQDLENNFLAKLRPTLDSLSKERGFLFVFNQDSGLLAWENPALDITADLVKRMNQP